MIHEAFPPKSISYSVGANDGIREVFGRVRGMITVAIGALKEVKAQVYERPGTRFLIGEILSCLGSAHKATRVDPDSLQFKKL